MANVAVIVFAFRFRHSNFGSLMLKFTKTLLVFFAKSFFYPFMAFFSLLFLFYLNWLVVELAKTLQVFFTYPFLSPMSAGNEGLILLMFFFFLRILNVSVRIKSI